MHVLGFAGFSGSGKTTLIEQLIPLLGAAGIRVSLIKHAHHDFDIDTPGKDSWRHRKAGAHEVLITSGQRWALMHELRGAPEPGLSHQLRQLSPCDLVVVEGFKRESFAKIEVRRAAHPTPALAPEDPWIIAVASDQPLQEGALPVLDLNDPGKIADFILAWLRDQRTAVDALHPLGAVPERAGADAVHPRISNPTGTGVADGAAQHPDEEG